MATDLPQQNAQNSFSRQQNFGQKNSNVVTKKKKGLSPILVIIPILLIAVAVVSVIMPKKKQVATTAPAIESSTISESVETTIDISESKNVVSDFNAKDGYWSDDAEFFYRNGTVQKNQWIDDTYYVGDDGRKVRNKLIDDTYYVDAKGLKLRNEWYRFTKKIGSTDVVIWYYFGDDGAKLKDTFTPDGFYVDDAGMYVAGEENDTPDSVHFIPNEN